MIVSASAVLCRELLDAQAAANSTTAVDVNAHPATTAAGAGLHRDFASRRSRGAHGARQAKLRGAPFCVADIASFLAGRSDAPCAPARLGQHYLMRLIKKPRAGAGFSCRWTCWRRPSAAERTATLARALWTLLRLVDAQ